LFAYQTLPSSTDDVETIFGGRLCPLVGWSTSVVPFVAHFELGIYRELGGCKDTLSSAI